MDNNPSETITGVPNVSTAGGKENVSEETVGFAEFVNRELGTQYKDDDAAVEGLKQTKSYVGRVGQVMPFFDKASERGIPTSKLFEAMDQIINGQEAPKAPTPDTSNFVTKEEFNRQMFYKDHPDYQAFQPIIDAMALATKQEPGQVVETEAFKTVFEKSKGFDEVQKAKSVLQTNSRLGVASDNMTKAAEFAKAGQFDQAAAKAIDAVIEAYPGK